MAADVGAAALKRRIRDLDSLCQPGKSSLVDLCVSFVSVLSEASFRGTPDEFTPLVDATCVDELTSSSHLIGELLEAAPWLENGPTSPQTTQRWISVGPRQIGPKPSKEPWFRNGQGKVAQKQPGYFTSSAGAGYDGMWRTFLDLNAPEIRLWPKPWTTWELVPESGMNVFQVQTARDWVSLVEDHPHKEGPLVRPDWVAVANTYDAVHFSPRAIAAVEGFRVRSQVGLLAPVYWDVESTLWLRWQFRSIRRLCEHL